MRDDRLGYDVPDEEYDNMSEEDCNGRPNRLPDHAAAAQSIRKTSARESRRETKWDGMDRG